MESKLEYIYTVYQEKSFVRAAEKLYISQPSLSITIKRIEDNLGFAIFDRSRKPLDVTEEGRAYIDYIEGILALDAQLAERVNEIEQFSTGTIRIGCTNYILSSVLPVIIHSLNKQYPGIKVDISEDNSLNMRQRILNGDLDMVVDCFDTSDASLEFVPLLNEELVLTAPKAYAEDPRFQPYLLTRESIRSDRGNYPLLPDALAKEIFSTPLLSFRPGYDMYERIHSILKQYDATANVRMEFDQITTCINYVDESIGYSLLPITPFLYNKRKYDVALFAIRSEGFMRTQKLIWKKGKYRSKVINLFTQIAQDCYGSSAALSQS